MFDKRIYKTLIEFATDCTISGSEASVGVDQDLTTDRHKTSLNRSDQLTHEW